MRNITSIIDEKLQQQNAPTPFSVLKEMQPTNLDSVFPESRKNYAYEIGKDISAHMREHDIHYARITTASTNGTAVRWVINLKAIKKTKPELRNVSDTHPDISQCLGGDYYLVNPRFLTA